MKKFLYILLAVFAVFSLSACHRKNEDVNLQLESHKGSTYVVNYYSETKKNFGDLYITIEDEKIVNFYVVYSKDYVLDKFEFTVGGYSNKVNQSEVEEASKKTNKIVFTLENALNLITEKDSEDSEYDTPNSLELKFYVSFEPAEGSDVKTSSLSFYVTPEEIVEFIRNKELKVREDAE